MRILISMFIALSLIPHATAATKEELVDQLFDILEIEQDMQARIPEGFVKGIKAALEPRGVVLTQEQINVAQQEFLKEFMPHLPKITAYSKNLYLETFTIDELQKAIEFYSTPEGKIIYKKSMDLTEKAMLFTMPISMEAGQKAGKKLGQYIQQSK